MKRFTRTVSIVGLVSALQIVSAGSITDTYNTGDTLTTTTLDNIKSAVNDNDARITTLETASVPIIVKDSDSSVVGRLIATDESFSWWVINSMGFILELDGDGNLGYEILHFTGPSCTNTAYVPDSETSRRVAAKQGYVFTDPTGGSVYYLSANTSKTSSISTLSRYELSFDTSYTPIVTVTCVNNSETIDGFQALPNVPGITGVPSTSYGPVSLQ